MAQAILPASIERAGCRPGDLQKGRTTMQVQITSKHMDVTAAVEEYATTKVDKFPRYFDRIQQVEVILDKARVGYIAEIIVDVEHHEPFVARCEHDDLYASIDLAADRSIRQLTDHKSRLRDNKHHAPSGRNQP
jgi:putative sigma-54 modulation protein